MTFLLLQLSHLALTVPPPLSSSLTPSSLISSPGPRPHLVKPLLHPALHTCLAHPVSYHTLYSSGDFTPSRGNRVLWKWTPTWLSSILWRHMVCMQGTFMGRVRLFWVEHVFLNKHLFPLQVKKKKWMLYVLRQSWETSLRCKWKQFRWLPSFSSFRTQMAWWLLNSSKYTKIEKFPPASFRI